MEHLTISLWALVLLVAVALAFDFMNGFHDGANSISTIVATGALTPKQAVIFAAAFNFAALWVFQLKVAATIGKGTVEWRRATWDDMPTQYHIVNGLAALPVREWRGASVISEVGGKDLSDMRVLR